MWKQFYLKESLSELFTLKISLEYLCKNEDLSCGSLNYKNKVKEVDRSVKWGHHFLASLWVPREVMLVKVLCNSHCAMALLVTRMPGEWFPSLLHIPKAWPFPDAATEGGSASLNVQPWQPLPPARMSTVQDGVLSPHHCGAWAWQRSRLTASPPFLPFRSGQGRIQGGSYLSLSALPPPTAARFGAGAISSNFSTPQNQLGSLQKCRVLRLTPESLIQQVWEGTGHLHSYSAPLEPHLQKPCTVGQPTGLYC